MFPLHSFRSVILACTALALTLEWVSAAEPLRIVLQNGRSLPLTAVTLQGGGFRVTAALFLSFQPCFFVRIFLLLGGVVASLDRL